MASPEAVWESLQKNLISFFLKNTGLAKGPIIFKSENLKDITRGVYSLMIFDYILLFSF